MPFALCACKHSQVFAEILLQQIHFKILRACKACVLNNRSFLFRAGLFTNGRSLYNPKDTRILVVDDQPNNLLAFESALSNVGCQIVTCCSGRAALDLIVKSDFAVILLDVQMPEMDGFETAKRIRQTEMGAQTPIVFVSAIDRDDSYVLAAYNLGAADFIFKPVASEILRAKVVFFVKAFDLRKELELKTAQLQQNAESEKLEILEKALDAVVATDDKNRVIFWNANAEKIFGWAKTEILGQELTDFIVPERFRSGHRAGLERFLKTGIAKIQNQRVEIFGLKKDGTEFPIELTLSSIMSSSGYRFYSFIRDLTEEKARAKELDTLNENFQGFFQQSPLPMFILEGPQHRFSLANKPYENFVGWQVVGKTVSEAFPKGEAKEFIPLLNRVYQTGEPYIGKALPVTMPDENGSSKCQYLDVGYYPFHDSSGNIKGILGLFQDVTDQVAAMNRVEEGEANLRAAINSSAGGFYGVDREGVTTICNAAFLKILGFEKLEDAVGKKLHDVIHHSHPDGTHYEKTHCPIYQAASSGMPAHIVNELFFRLDGSSLPVEYWSTPIMRDGQVLGAVTTFIDISDRIKADAALREAKENADRLREEAVRANDLKSAFLANMSHEIRTPLGAMLGFADLLKDAGLSAGERANYVNILTRNGEQLSVLINDILDLSKVEAGHLTLEYTDTYHEQIGSDVVSLLHVKAREKDLSLEYSFDDGTPESITADPTRVRQILLNLVGNAIKFTQFGSVKIKTYGCHIGPRPSLCFEISDTGIGMDKAQQSKLFQPFSQADESTTRKFGGTGLGLALSLRLARELGGDVSIVHSQVGVGTTFLLKIADQPEKRSSPEDRFKVETRTEPEVKDNELAGLKILVVDDAPDNQQLIWRYLTKQGAAVQSAENGLLGYRTALAGDFDLVLMDIQMPVMDGYTATQKLREAGYRKPIVALTAHAMNEIRKKALNVGYTDHLTKPIKPKELIATIARLVAN